MTFLSSVVFAVFIAVFFYLVIPGLGAFLVRYRWRRFRADVLESAAFPLLNYSDMHRPGRYRIFGRLEAVQGDDLVWLENQGVSVAVSMTNVPIYIIPGGGASAGEGSRSLPDESPRVVYWQELTALAEGTQVYVAGHAEEEPGGIVFRGNKRHDPLFIIYDGPEHLFLKRTIWTGRQRNEYWNHLTLPALTGGFLAELVLAVFTLNESRLAALIATVLSLVPVLPLVPPGVLGYYFYRRIWRRARRHRAIRDVMKLSIRTGRDGADGATGSLTNRTHGKYVWLGEVAAVLFLLAGVSVNAYGLAVILALTVFR